MKNLFKYSAAAAALMTAFCASLPCVAGADILKGDVNGDNSFNVADAAALSGYLLGRNSLADYTHGDYTGDGVIDSFDLIYMRKDLTTPPIIIEPETYYFDVTNVSELYKAVNDATENVVIRVAPGEYNLTSTLECSYDGTEDYPIKLIASDPENPPVIKGSNIQSGYVIHVQGDCWIFENLIVCNSQKGIVIDNSNNTIIQSCEIYDTGAEAVAIRDGSSYCSVINSYIHDTGLVTPAYGEGVYIGSANSTTGFDYECDYNVVKGCTFDNVAAEHVDIKEYTTGNEVSYCTFYGNGMTGENYAGSFVDIAGNDVYVHHNTGYRNGNIQIVAAFELHEQVEGWGYGCSFTDNTVYMDQPYGAVNTSRRMYVVDGWFSDFSVKNNLVDYGEGLVAADSWEYYNSDYVVYLE